MKIVICGSMVFSQEMVEIEKKLKAKGIEVVLPKHTEEYSLKRKTEIPTESANNKIKDDLIRDYYHEINNADAILALNIDKNGIANYIGGNTFLEMGFAHVLNKKIYLYNDIPEVSYKDEVIAMQPIILNEDLNKIK